jgi:glycosyltransferase involved in cell wall biosynthesis
MRVTMLVRCLAMMRGGGETRHLAWARELTALGVDVEIVTGRPVLAPPRYPVHGFTTTMVRSAYARNFVYRFQQRRGFGRLTTTALHVDEEWFCRAAWRRIAAGSRTPDVVHAHALHQAARLRRCNLPVVIHLPGAPNRRYYADLHEADALVADGWAAEHLPEAIGRPVEHVPKGVDAERFRPDGDSVRQSLRLEHKRVVLAVARLVPIKNLTLLVEAVGILRERVGNVHLLIVGDGPEGGALRQLAAVRGLADAVTFAGAIPFEETPRFYRSADVFALSSRFDNSPNVVLEAMASGLPVVTTAVGGVGDFVTDRVGGCVVPANDAFALAAALERYRTSPAAAHEAGDHNRLKATTAFSWRASALQLLSVYNSVIAGRRGVDRVTA